MIQPTVLPTAHGALRLPAFLPDATRGAVRAADAVDLAAVGIEAVVVNTLHLSHRPGADLLARLGGVHRYMGWDRPVVSDSGGFQVYSLVTGREKLGSVSARGFTYRMEKGGKSQTLTPEKCIQRQFRIGADVMYCLDHCTHPEAPAEEQRASVEHTVAWARACRDEFDRRAEKLDARPQLFAVVQGGNDPALRRECAARLVEIGFDGFGFGGWPIDREGALVEMVAFVASLLPDDLPRHALGIGKPENLVAAFRAGYNIFDCVIPTRDARHKRLYTFADGPALYRCVYLQDEKHARDGGPLEEGCDCPLCARYSRAYLHHMFRFDDPVAYRLATLHNLRFYARLVERLRDDG